MEAPETRFALSSRGDRVAYQVIGSGPVDVLVARSSVFSIESMWDEPRLVHFLSQLSAFSRHIWFDFRGTGASDAIAPTESQLLESMVDDMVTVVDAVDCDRAVVLVLGAPAGLVFAATRPERTASVAIVNTVARYRRADDYPEGLSDELVEERLSAASLPTAAIVAPSLVSDVPFTRWLGRASRLMVPPNERRVRLRALYDHDVRGVLGSVQAPALVILRARHCGCGSVPLRRRAHPGRSPRRGGRRGSVPDRRLGPDPRADRGVRHRRAERSRVRSCARDGAVHGSRTPPSRSRKWAIDDGATSWRPTMRSSVPRSTGCRARSSGSPATGCWQRSTVPRVRSAARWGSATCSRPSVWSSAPGCTPVRSTCTAMMCQGSRCTSVSASVSMPDREKYSCRRTVADLIAGSDIELEDAGEHELKGVTGTWRLLRVANA